MFPLFFFEISSCFHVTPTKVFCTDKVKEQGSHSLMNSDYCEVAKDFSEEEEITWKVN